MKGKSYKRLIGPDGGFVSSFDEGTMGHILELCEFVYHHNNQTDKEKLKIIRTLETGMEKEVKSMYGRNVVFIYHWTEKMRRKIEKSKS